MTQYLTHLDSIVFKKLPLDELESSVPELVLDSGDNKNAIAHYLRQCQSAITGLIEKNISSLSCHHLRSLMMDQLISKLFQQGLAKEKSLSPESITLIAVGGYGREEMSLHSDIDLNIIHEGTNRDSIKAFVEKILYPLWDAKLDVGYAVRTLKECWTILKSDQTVLTSLLDARFVAGNKLIFEKLKAGLLGILSRSGPRLNLIRQKITERELRLKKYGDSVYLLKPNVKEGPGALRDLHVLRWLATLMGLEGSFASLLKKEYISEEEYKALDFALKFFLQIRNRLNLQLKKKSDQMGFEQQIAIAHELGFTDTGSGILAVERFMQTYYTVASQTRAICQKVIFRILATQESWFTRLKNRLAEKNLDGNFKTLRQKIMVRNNGLFKDEPLNLMQVFRHQQLTGLSLHYSTKDLISSHLYLVDKRFRENQQVAALFREIMGDLRHLGKTLQSMHDVHFFDTYIPEFRKLRNRVQHDIYHVYTVDTHSIFAVGELSKLAAGEYAGTFDLYARALQEVKQPELLTLGLLFHDIGKGEGGNHSAVGTRLADSITRRLGYTESERQMITLLVLSHLMMSHLSQRRDLEDEHLILEFAKTIKSPDTLNMLFLLTWADIRAVNPENWTGWKGTLLKSLYEKTRAVLEKGDFSEDLTLSRVADIRKNILERLKDRTPEMDLQEFLEMITARYLRTHSDTEILEHFGLIQKHKHENFFLTAREISEAHATEILIYAMNNPRLLALITGVMLSLGLNILTLEVFGLSNGSILVKLQVQTEFNTSISKIQVIEDMKKRLKAVFTGEENIARLIARYKKPLSLKLNKPVGLAKSDVVIDNDVSPFYTVIDIFTHDRLGLLYDIVTCLAEQGCYVEVSKISTKVEQVVDSLYVKDIFGGKITSKNKLRDMQNALMQLIEGPSGKSTQNLLTGPIT